MGSPLESLRVLEVANFITGPYAGQLLADLGAEVIKIEEPKAGDPFRSWGEGLYSPHYRAYNRGKQSLTLNLASEPGREILFRLIPQTDVLIENFRPGVAQRLGFGFDFVHAINRRLVYCSIAGFGESGPYSSRPAYDTVGQALSGLLSLLTDLKAPRPVGPAFSDSLTGIFACYGILAALLARERTGEGQKIEVSMLSATLGFLLEPAASFFASGEPPGPYSRPQIAQVYAFCGADGKAFAIHLSSPQKFWEGLTEAVERPNLRQDSRFRTRDDRIAHYQELQQTLADIFCTRSRRDWLDRLGKYDVPSAPIYSLQEVFEDPQVRHLGLETSYHHPAMGTVRSIAPPVTLTGTSLPPVAAPPVLGEHTEAILLRLGYNAEEIARLKADKVI